MDPLKRDNPGVRATNHEDRIQALERRIFLQPSVWAFGRATTPQSVGSGGTTVLQFEDFWTGDKAIFRTTNNAAGDTIILCNEFGIYVATMSVEWEDIGSDYPHESHISTTRQIGANLGTFGGAAATTSDSGWLPSSTNPVDTGDVLIGVHSDWDYLPTQPAGWSVLVSHDAGVPVDVLRFMLMVTLLPSDEKEEDYVVF